MKIQYRMAGVKRRYRVDEVPVFREYVDAYPADGSPSPAPYMQGCRINRVPMDEPVCDIYKVWYWRGGTEHHKFPEGLSYQEALALAREKYPAVLSGKAHCEFSGTRFDHSWEVEVSVCESSLCKEAAVCIPSYLCESSSQFGMYGLIRKWVMELARKDGWLGKSLEGESGAAVHMDFDPVPVREKAVCRRDLVIITPAEIESRYIEVSAGAMGVDHVRMAFPMARPGSPGVTYSVTFEGLI